MKIKTMDFLKGIDDASDVLAEILDKGIFADLGKKKVLKIADNAANVFSQCKKSDVEAYESKGQNERMIMHYMAFINTEAYLKISE